MGEESTGTKQKLTQSEQENSNLQSHVKKLTDDVTKATEDVTAKDAVIADLKSKDLQVPFILLLPRVWKAYRFFIVGKYQLFDF